MQVLSKRLTYANVMATVAVFIALGGTGYAMTRLPKNSVGTKQIKPHAVGTKQIKAGAVRTAQVADGSLQSSDFAANQLPAGERGPAGTDGAPGPPGPTFAVTADRPDPTPTPDRPVLLGTFFKFTTPAAGKLLLNLYGNPGTGFTSEGIEVVCSGGGVNVGLYLDGAPVPDTQAAFDNETYEIFTLVGVTAEAVPAGEHELALGANCPSGSYESASLHENVTLSAVLLG